MKKNKNTLSKNKLYTFLILFGLAGCFLAVFFHLTGNSRIVLAESDSEEELQGDLESLEQEARGYRKMIELKKKQQNTLKDQLEIMETHEENIENNITKTKKEIDDKQDEIKKLEEDINKKQQEIDKSKEGLAEMIRSYYKIEKEINLAILSSKGDLADIFNHSEYLNQTSQEVEKKLKGIKEIKKELNKKKNELEDNRKALENNEKELQGKLADLNYQQKSKNFLLTKTRGEEARYQKLLADIEDEIYNLESKKTVNYDNIPASKNGYFDYPVSSVRITQEYGMTAYAKTGVYGGGPHNGVDFGVNHENIFAVRDGKVRATGDNHGYAYGKWIAVDHGDGLITLYGHLSKIKVGRGEKVDKGDVIAISGNTGNSTGPHLHFSVFDAKTFEITNSKHVNGLKIPAGASISPNRYF